MIDLCVINYNSGKELQRMLYYLWMDPNQKDNPTFHIDPSRNFRLYIADNGSTDWSRSFLFVPYTDAPVDFNSNIGYAAAANKLAAKGDGDIIGILNADVWFTQVDLQEIQDAFDKDPTISILGPKQRNEEGRITHAGIEGTNTSCRPRAWQYDDPHDQYFRYQEDMVSVAGSAYFIRRSVWDFLTECPIYQEVHPGAIGAFLPVPLMYYEETWCSYHAREHGFRVVYDGNISIGHSWAASSGGQNSNMHNEFLKSQVVFREMCERHNILHD